MADELNPKTKLVARNCPTCGCVYAIPQVMLDSAELTGSSWYCPNGHNLVFAKPKIPGLEAEVATLKASLAQALEDKRLAVACIPRLGGLRPEEEPQRFAWWRRRPR